MSDINENSTPDEDVESHRTSVTGSDDVEGHKMSLSEDGDEDVEGHVQPRRDIDVER